MSDAKTQETYSMLKSKGLSERDARDIAARMKVLGEDMASFNNLTPEELLANLQAHPGLPGL